MFDGTEVAEQCRKAAGADVGLAGDDELCDAVRELAVARSALDAAEGHVLAELEARGVCEREFGLSTTSWVADRTKAPRGVVAGRVRVGRQAAHPACGRWTRRWATGTIRFEHARAMVEAANPRIADEIADRQDELVESARTAPFAIWRSELGALAELLDQDGGYDPDRDLARNTMRITPLGPDHIAIKGELVGEAALTVRQALEREADKVWRRAQRDHEADRRRRRPPPAHLPGARAWPNCAAAPKPSTPKPHTAPASTSPSSCPTPTTPTRSAPPTANRSSPAATATSPATPASTPSSSTSSASPSTWAANSATPTGPSAAPSPPATAAASSPAATPPPPGATPTTSSTGTTTAPPTSPTWPSLCRYHHGITHRRGWTMTATHDQHFTLDHPHRTEPSTPNATAAAPTASGYDVTGANSTSAASSPTGSKHTSTRMPTRTSSGVDLDQVGHEPRALVEVDERDDSGSRWRNDRE